MMYKRIKDLVQVFENKNKGWKIELSVGAIYNTIEIKAKNKEHKWVTSAIIDQFEFLNAKNDLLVFTEYLRRIEAEINRFNALLLK